MRHASTTSFFHRQAGLGAVPGLNLARFIDAEDCRFIWRIPIESHHIGQLLDELLVARKLKTPLRCGSRPRASQIRCTVAGLTPCAWAIARTLQWVAAF